MNQRVDQALLDIYQKVASIEGSFCGRERLRLKKDADVLAEVEAQVINIWSELELDTMWELNCLTYAASTTSVQWLANPGQDKAKSEMELETEDDRLTLEVMRDPGRGGMRKSRRQPYPTQYPAPP